MKPPRTISARSSNSCKFLLTCRLSSFHTQLRRSPHAPLARRHRRLGRAGSHLGRLRRRWGRRHREHTRLATSADPTSVSGDLTWWDTSDPTNEGPACKALIKQFNEEYPNVNINYESVPFAEAQNKFKTAAASGSGAPDILRAEVAWVPEFASLGYLYSLDGTELLEDKDDFLETPLSSNVYDGKTYGVPQVTDTLALMYNKKLFDEGRHRGRARPPGPRSRTPPTSSRRSAPTASTSTPAATSRFRSSTARVATSSTPRRRRSRSTRPRPSPASPRRRSSSRAVPRSSPSPTTPTAR